MKRVPRPWVTGAFLLLAALSPAELLEYDRARVGAGELWRLATGQFVHWTPRMAFFDLGVILVLGTLLELAEERRVLAHALWLGLVASSLAVHVFQPQLAFYRGSSGIATALFAVVVLRGAKERSSHGRILLLFAALGLAGKLALEASAGQLLFAGTLPPGVNVSPAVHLAGLVAGLVEMVWGGVEKQVRRHAQA